MAGNRNPAEVLLQQQRMAARRRMAEENMSAPTGAQGRPISRGNSMDILSEDIRGLGLIGFAQGDGSYEVEIPDDPTGLGQNENRDAAARVGAQKAITSNDSIALEFDATKEDKTPLEVVAANLKKTTFPSASDKFLREKISNLVADGGGRITFAMAGKILEKSQGQLDAEGSLGRAGQQLNRGFWNKLTGGMFGTVTPDLGGGRTLNDDKVSGFVREIKDGVVDVNLSRIKSQEAAQTQIATAEANYQKAVSDYQLVLQKAQAGNPRAVNLLPGVQRRVDEARRQAGVTRGLGVMDSYTGPGPGAEPDPEIEARKNAELLAENFRRYYGKR